MGGVSLSLIDRVITFCQYDMEKLDIRYLPHGFSLRVILLLIIN